MPARNFSSNIDAPAGDATDNLAGTVNTNLFGLDDEEDSGTADARLSDPTPKKLPDFDVEKIRFQLVQNEKHKHVLPETVVGQEEHISESMVQVLQSDFKPTAHYENSD